ncbi:hypothetical protein [uncultured Pseudokineococcus sp.]|uniref:hypothetical protein n=1 Tax=uncultured Pseudokineococcus sp. TaxID=1642928 RepID=UPI002636F9A0|nr:hypothetical protein [uncultured Pseudokineococcus sp.]
MSDRPLPADPSDDDERPDGLSDDVPHGAPGDVPGDVSRAPRDGDEPAADVHGPGGQAQEQPRESPGTSSEARPSAHPTEEEVDALLDADLVAVRERRERADGAPPPEALTAAHVLGCSRCQGVLADMRAVRGLLRRQGAGAPPPPDDLADRIARAVADDAARERRAARSRRRRAVLTLAASAVVVGGLGTAVALQVRPLQERGAPAGSDLAAAPAAAEPLVMASGTDYGLGTLGAQVRAVLAAPTTASGAAPDRSASSLDDPAGPGGDTSGDDATGGRPDAGRADSAPAEGGTGAGAEGGDAAPARGGDAAPTAPSGLARADELEPCLAALGRPDARVLAVDTARWEGRAADVLVLDGPATGGTDAGDPASAPLAVWVVRLGCRGGDDALLHYEVVPR